MLLLLIASLCVSLTVGKHVVDKEYLACNNQSQKLVWPERYTVKAIKMILTSDIVEDMVTWKTNGKSRVDYNEGAVKSITILGAEPVKYEMHPETNRIGSISLVCHNVSQALPSVKLDEILPDLAYLKENGNETVNDIKTTIFAMNINYKPKIGIPSTKQKVLWATYNQDDCIWVPVKYELTDIREDLVRNHEIWYFSDFSTKFDDSVFDIVDNNCLKNEIVSHEPDSRKVTKELFSVNPDDEKHVEHIFNHFKTQYNRQYADEKELTLRKTIFIENMRFISTTNRKNLSYKLGINQFADKTFEETERDHTGLLKEPEGKFGNIPFPYSEDKLKSIVENLPEEHDLRLMGLVSSVKNQETCNSGWAFASASAAEGALARTNGGRLKSLSAQALVDCAWGYGAHGCKGGMDTVAYEWMMNFGLPTVEEYGPYKNWDGFCHIANNITRYPIKGYTNVTPMSHNALKVAIVNHGPLTVFVQKTQNFLYYSSGVFYEKGCGQVTVNHIVNLVGYGVEHGDLYWVLKNSMGEMWGEGGYMRITARENNCGIATKPTYVVY